ncbi:MAG: glutathione synthase [Candidatus Omnitrophota bacterium]
MKIAFLLYPTAGVKVNEDSSFWIMRELARRGHQVFYFESKDLIGREDGPWAYLRRARLDVRRGYLPSPLSAKATNLSALDSLFIRKEPPFDNAYLYALQLLELVKDRVFVLNDPAGIAIANEKTFTCRFPKYVPETLITEDPARAAHFVRNVGRKMVVKPLNEKGGKGVFAVSPGDPALLPKLETATRHAAEKILLQRFIPENNRGDKRILILNGGILGAFLRKPSRRDFRANLSQGGTMHRASVAPWERRLVESMAPELARYGLWFVGIDVIGRFLTEVNVTSPAGIPEINFFEKSRPERDVADFIERRSADRRRF